MATKILKHGDYQGVLPEGWDVVELQAGHCVVKQVDLQDLIKQLNHAKAVIDQAAKVFGMVNKIDPGIFGGASVNWGGLVMKLQMNQGSAKELGPEFAKLNALVAAYGKNYNVQIIS